MSAVLPLVHPVTVPAPVERRVPRVLGRAWDFQQDPVAAFLDLFCGLGGGTTGKRSAIERAGFVVGESARVIAVNHDPDALAMHAANHPDVEHINSDLETLSPRLVLTGHSCEACETLVVTTPCPVTGIRGSELTGMLTCAPCQPYSPANGKRVYVRPQMRATPDYSRKFRRLGRPAFVIEENVRQIATEWPDWSAYIQGYREDGYEVEHRILCAADYGVPQERYRLIMVAVRRDVLQGRPIPWPRKSHSEGAREPGTFPWQGSGSSLDLEEWSPSFFEGKKDSTGRATGTPYSPRVRARIARYIREQGRFWWPLAEAVLTFSGPVPLAGMLEACPRSEWPAWITVDDEERVVIDAVLAEADFARVDHAFVVGQQDGNVCRPTSDPCMTVATAGYVRVAQIRCLVPQRGPHGGPNSNLPRSVTEPSHTVLAGRRHGSVAEARIFTRTGGLEVRFTSVDPVILPHHGERPGQQPRVHRARDPAPTVPARRKLDAAFPFIVTYNGKPQADPTSEPATTITTRPRHYVVSARLVDAYADLGYRPVKAREAALLQGFPPGVKLVGSAEAQQRGIGNAVPPPLIDAVVSALLNMRGIAQTRLATYDESVKP